MKILRVEYPKGIMTLECFENFCIIKNHKGYSKIEHSSKNKNDVIDQLIFESNNYEKFIKESKDDIFITKARMIIKANCEMIDFLKVI